MKRWVTRFRRLALGAVADAREAVCVRRLLGPEPCWRRGKDVEDEARERERPAADSREAVRGDVGHGHGPRRDPEAHLQRRGVERVFVYM